MLTVKTAPQNIIQLISYTSLYISRVALVYGSKKHMWKILPSL